MLVPLFREFSTGALGLFLLEELSCAEFGALLLKGLFGGGTLFIVLGMLSIEAPFILASLRRALNALLATGALDTLPHEAPPLFQEALDRLARQALVHGGR